MATGGSSPYVATASGFDIYIYYPITPATANSAGYLWHIEWIAVGN